MFNRNNRYEACPKCQAVGRDTRGDNLVLWPDGSGHCFSCGYHLFPKHYVPKPKEQLNVPKSLRPIDFTREVPAVALKWLLQFGLPWSYWKDTIGFSPTESRLIFEIKSEGILRFSIGRYIDGYHSEPLRQTGELSLGRGGELRGISTENQDESRLRGVPRKWHVYGDPHRHCHVMLSSSASENIGGNPIVLVEDLISAAKVSQLTTTIPLFGTKLHDPHWYYLINNDKPIIIWLDKDQEGYVNKLALKIQQILARRVKVVLTDKDPKWLSKEQIIGYL